MVNITITTELGQRNEELLEKNKKLKKQLADEEEYFKLRIWNAVHNITERLVLL